VSDGFATRRAPLRVRGVVALVVLALVAHGAASHNAASNQQPRGTARQVLFTQYDPFFSNAEILRRLLSPLAQAAVRDSLARSLETLAPYPIDLAKERFLVYVPSAAPPWPRGFALLVFVPPSDQDHLPFGWASQLEHHGVILVIPAAAGNTEAVLSRRVPLALSAEENIVRQYPVDRQRIYIGGFSGGSRVALRIALGYPDVFHGALLEAGSDPLGRGYPLPPRDLFRRFQSSSHLVYVTGDRDTAHLASDASSLQSMRKWCVFNVESDEMAGVGHEVMSSEAFGQALARLLTPAPPDGARLAACRSHVEAGLDEKVGQAEALISRGRRAAARRLLLEIDSHYGGLAAGRILRLARSCRCGLAQPDGSS
jgi:pimeloyl-ACP methyl ester carboxylesterase